MVNRKFKSSIVTRRRSFPPDYKKGRPKRNVSPKVLLEDTVTGISWKEERELKKALYASLQESRRSSRDERPEGDEEQSCDSMDSAAPDSLDSAAQSPVGLPGLIDESSNSQDAMPLPVRPKPDTAKNKFHAQRKYAQNSMPMLHSETPPGGFQKKVHAQRKFAQGSHPSTPSETPSKPRFKASPVRLFPVRPKTEDFLTYLCFRGTNLLPPHLDLLNVTQYTENIEPSTPSNNGRPGHTRESSPASSSTISHTNEDSVDIPDLTPRSQTPNRKAARASASTPETARGFLRYPSSNGRHSGTKASPLSRDKVSQDVSSRTRYGDRFSPASRVLKMPRKESPIKLGTTAADRLALKRKAMATLTAAKKTDKSHRSGKMFKKALSEGEMMKRKVIEGFGAEINVDIDVVANDDSESEPIDVVNIVDSSVDDDDNSEEVDSYLDDDDNNVEESHSCELDYDVDMSGCCDLNPLVDDDACECFGCFDNIVDDPFEGLSKFQYDINNNSETVHKMMTGFDANLMYCNTNTESQQSEIDSMNESCETNIDVENISMNDDLFGTRSTDEMFTDFEKNITCSVGKPEVTAKVGLANMLDNADRTSKTKGIRETSQPENVHIKLDTWCNKGSVPVVQKTDVDFVSALFNPLSSDLDESIDIPVLDEVSLDDSIDLDEMLNYDETEELSLIGPEAVKKKSSERTGQLSKQCAKDGLDMNNNTADNKGKSYVETKMVEANKGTMKQMYIKSNSLFKPAFNTSPKPLFKGIIELASGITGPKVKPSIIGPAVISQDHAYSKIKKPVHFSLRSNNMTLKYKEVQSMFMGSQSLSVVKSLNHLNCAPLKAINVGHENKIKEVASLSPCNKTVEISNGGLMEKFKQDESKETPLVKLEDDFNAPIDNTSAEKIDIKQAEAPYVNELLECKTGDKNSKEFVIHVHGPDLNNNQNYKELDKQETRSHSGAKEGIESENSKGFAGQGKDGCSLLEPGPHFIRVLRGRKVLQANLRDRHPITMQRIEKGHSPSRSNHSPSRSNQSKKRKSSSDLSHDSPPSPVKRMRKLRSSERVRKMLKAQAKTNSEKPVSKKYYSEFYETHPVKKLGTNVRAKPVKHKGPVTRASSHLKSMLTSAKLAATRKLRMLKRAHQTPRRDQRSLAHAGDRRSWSSGGTPKSSPDSSYSKSSGSPSPRTGLNGSPKQNGTSKQSPSPTKSEPFPKDREKANIVQCPTFHPTDEQFKDPLEYIQSISAKAEPYGICKIVPPPSWKMESRVIDDLRFTCQNQHIHKMLHRWGPNADRMEAIKRHFESTGTEKFQFPQIGGVEVDLVKLYDVVQRYGGMKRILDKKKWMKVADAMKIPKQAQDRITKLYSVYCKFLLSFETLSDEEQHKIEHSVQMDRQKQEKQRTHSNSATDKCVEKGRAQPFSAFNRAARNTLAMFGREDSESCAQIESDYWDYVESGEDHVCVQSATLDTSIYGSMFPVRRDNPYSRHPWNLHNFIQSKGCVLEHLGLIADVTVPTLRFGMLYTTTCLGCNSHNLPTVQYLHQGADIIWYAVPRQKTGHLKKALKEIVPSHVRDKGFILEKDSVMVPPDSLVEHGVPMTRCVQSSREFVLVFSGAYHCNISCGYTLSESVHYASMSWIPLGYHAAKDLSANHDAELFSMDAMLVFLARDISTNEETLSLLLPHLKQVVDRELSERQALHEAGLKERQKLPNRSARLSPKSEVLEEIVICDVSRKICYLSMVLNESENSAFSLEQGLIHLKKKKKDISNCKLMYRYSEEELKALVKDVKERIHKNEQQHSSSSSPTRMTLRKSTEKSSPINSSR